MTDDKLTNTNIYEKEDEEVADVENQIDASTETQTPVDESEQLPIPMPTHATEEEEDTGESDLPPPPPPIPAPCQLERRYTSYSSPTVQVWDPVEDCYTRVEGNCAICINDYQVGDVLVRSAAGKGEEYCTHLYHYDCMLVWLEKGKKRCPICRHWFVPALRIKEQMKQEHVSLSQSRHHLFGMHNDCLASVAPTSNTSHSAHDESDHSNHNDDEHTTTSSVNNAAISLEEPPGASRLYDV